MSTELERCRAVKYTKGPAGRKGTRKCAECGFYFVPNDAKYPFFSDDPTTGGTVLLSGKAWHKETGCCQNCDLYMWRRCLGQRRGKDKHWNRGCGKWFQLESQYCRSQEKQGRNRRVVCAKCQIVTQSQMKQKLLEMGKEFVKELDRAPTRHEFESYCKSARHVTKVFGSWNNFVVALGKDPRKQGQITLKSRNSRNITGLLKAASTKRFSPTRCLEALREKGTEFGCALSIREWDNHGFRPNASLICKRIGWNSGWEKAGFKPNVSFSENKQQRDEVRNGTPLLDLGRKAYEILDDPNSEYNQQRREIERKTERYLEEMEEATQRWEDGKFKKGAKT